MEKYDVIFLAAPKFLHVSGKVILFEVGRNGGGDTRVEGFYQVDDIWREGRPIDEAL